MPEYAMSAKASQETQFWVVCKIAKRSVYDNQKKMMVKNAGFNI